MSCFAIVALRSLFIGNPDIQASTENQKILTEVAFNLDLAASIFLGIYCSLNFLVHTVDFLVLQVMLEYNNDE